MTKSVLGLATIALLTGLAHPREAAADASLSAELRGNLANQSIVGFPSSVATWSIERGRVSLKRGPNGQSVIVVRTRGLIIPALGFNPSPDILARIVCHDSAGNPSEAA